MIETPTNDLIFLERVSMRPLRRGCSKVRSYPFGIPSWQPWLLKAAATQAWHQFV